MSKHTYGGNPKPPPPPIRDIFSGSHSSHSNTTPAPTYSTNNHNGSAGWIDGGKKPSSTLSTRKLGSW